MFIKSVVALILVLCVANGSFAFSRLNQRKRREATKPWGYRDADKSLLPDNWGTAYPKCYGSRQSPIDILTNNTVFSAALDQIYINQTGTSGSNNESWQVKNNGHSGKENLNINLFLNSQDFILESKIYKFYVSRVISVG
jgi:hypothetical protein